MYNLFQYLKQQKVSLNQLLRLISVGMAASTIYAVLTLV
jgi:hypothetical protein